jgi:hypothetical protein
VIWGEVQWQEAEILQREMGRMILRCSPKMANEVVLGELGWWKLKTRRDFLILKYWGKVVMMKKKRLVWTVYNHNRSQYEESQRNLGKRAINSGSMKWCKYVHHALESIGLGWVWEKNTLTKKQARSWGAILRDKLGKKEEMEWKKAVADKPKLRTYALLKKKLLFENYLNSSDRKAIEILTTLRGGTNELRIETGRYPITNRDRRLAISERKCLLCLSEEVEDEIHFMLDCTKYADLRRTLFDITKRVLIEHIDIDKEGRSR